jgi:hypothetical protein
MSYVPRAGCAKHTHPQGRPLGEPFQHALEVKEISLSQSGTINDRQLILIDRNRCAAGAS